MGRLGIAARFLFEEDFDTNTVQVPPLDVHRVPSGVGLTTGQEPLSATERPVESDGRPTAVGGDGPDFNGGVAEVGGAGFDGEVADFLVVVPLPDEALLLVDARIEAGRRDVPGASDDGGWIVVRLGLRENDWRADDYSHTLDLRIIIPKTHRTVDCFHPHRWENM